MKIISKFKDYYDNASHLLHDNSERQIVFIRNHIEIPISDEAKKCFSNCEAITLKYSNHNVYLEPFSILFCGKMYNGVKVDFDGVKISIPNTRNNKEIFGSTKVEAGCFYDNESLQNKLLEAGELKNKDEKTNKFSRWWDHKMSIKEHLEIKPHNLFEEFAIKNEIVIALFNFYERNLYQNDNAIMLVNPKLSKWDFYRAVEPFQAYQEIDMFTGGVLPQKHNLPIKISDKDRINQYGFDEWLFRKMPNKGLK